MATIKITLGNNPFYLAKESIVGLEQDRFFSGDQQSFDDFTEDEANALLNSNRGNTFVRTDNVKASAKLQSVVVDPAVAP